MDDNGIPIIYNRDLYEKGIKKPIKWDLETHPHMLIVGATGTGKTYTERLIMGKLTKYTSDLEITICDFKNEDFHNFANMPRHYGYEKCVDCLNAFYSDFQHRIDRLDKNPNVPRVMLFDEWGAFILSRDKKVADQFKAMVSTILLLGRSYHTHIILGLQRADAEHFKAGARDQMGVIIGLGNLSKEQKQMLFSEYKDDINNDCGRGKGYILRDGKGIKRCIVPTVGDMDKLNMEIASALTRNNEKTNT